MKSYNHLFPDIYDFKNLHLAYLKARRNKRYRREVLAFSANLEENLIDIQNHLIWKTYRTGKYHFFEIYEPKKRLVAALPFADRVVHHALCNVIEPIFDASFIYDSYACRQGKGVLAGVNRTTKILREAEHKWGEVYCLKCDVKKYFPSIDHEILRRIIRKKIACWDTLWLIDEIIDSTGGTNDLPIGNLTSQLWANVYLNELDHYIKELLRTKYYVRYMDDWIILHHDKKYLHGLQEEIASFLDSRLKLKFNAKTQIFPVRSRGIDFLGYRIWPEYRLLRKTNIKRMGRRLRKLQGLWSRREIKLEEIHIRIMSWLGHCKHADTYRLRNKMLDEFLLE